MQVEGLGHTPFARGGVPWVFLAGGYAVGIAQLLCKGAEVVSGLREGTGDTRTRGGDRGTHVLSGRTGVSQGPRSAMSSGTAVTSRGGSSCGPFVPSKNKCLLKFFEMKMQNVHFKRRFVFSCLQTMEKKWREILTRSTSPTVMAMALINMPIKPARNRDRLPAFSTRKTCRNTCSSSASSTAALRRFDQVH